MIFQLVLNLVKKRKKESQKFWITMINISQWIFGRTNSLFGFCVVLFIEYRANDGNNDTQNNSSSEKILWSSKWLDICQPQQNVSHNNLQIKQVSNIENLKGKGAANNSGVRISIAPSEYNFHNNRCKSCIKNWNCISERKAIKYFYSIIR